MNTQTVPQRFRGVSFLHLDDERDARRRELRDGFWIKTWMLYPPVFDELAEEVYPHFRKTDEPLTAYTEPYGRIKALRRAVERFERDEVEVVRYGHLVYGDKGVHEQALLAALIQWAACHNLTRDWQLSCALETMATWSLYSGSKVYTEFSGALENRYPSPLPPDVKRDRSDEELNVRLDRWPIGGDRVTFTPYLPWMPVDSYAEAFAERCEALEVKDPAKVKRAQRRLHRYLWWRIRCLKWRGYESVRLRKPVLHMAWTVHASVGGENSRQISELYAQYKEVGGKIKEIKSSDSTVQKAVRAMARRLGLPYPLRPGRPKLDAP